MTDLDTSSASDFLCSEVTKIIKQLNSDESALQTWPDALIQAYSEPQRHYHTTAHITSMLQLLRTHKHLITNSQAVQLSILFHDWVYDPLSHTNETDSVAIFIKFAAQFNLPSPLTQKVSHYIEATITHSLGNDDQDDEDLKLFLDFDLEVLGREREEYEDYARQIRMEYGHFGKEDYVKGRLGVLERFLARERLFFSDVMGRKLEGSARKNLGAEIEGLKASLRDGFEGEVLGRK